MRIKYVFVDLEGTLVKGSLMEHVLKMLDEKRFRIYNDVEKKLHMTKDRNYIIDQLRLFEGLKVDDIDKAVKQAPFRKGIAEGIKLFKEKGLKVVLLTDVIDVICESIKRMFGFDDYIGSPTLVENGVIRKVLKFNINKERGLEEYMKNNGISYDEIIHIGDWINDIPIFNKVKYGVAFMPSVPDVVYHATITVNIDDFEVLAKIIVNALLD